MACALELHRGRTAGRAASSCGRETREVSPSVQPNKRLTDAEVQELLLAYEPGGTVKGVDRQFGVHHSTARKLLDDAGVPRRLGRGAGGYRCGRLPGWRRCRKLRFRLPNRAQYDSLRSSPPPTLRVTIRTRSTYLRVATMSST